MRFAKGHGTENDFVVLPDPDDQLDLTPGLVTALCDRRAGIGADGVLRAVRHAGADAEWFMDYHNADGSLAQMCGNGVRVLARYLYDGGLADPRAELRVATRGGVKVVHPLDGGLLRVDMGTVDLPAADEPLTVATVHGRWPAEPAYAPNPHAVAFVDDLHAVGPLRPPPVVDPPGMFPDGVNVEFVVLRGPRHVAMRVHERGSGETRSCGTGVCAVAALANRRYPELWTDTETATAMTTWTVDVAGGRLWVDVAPDGSVALTGPAVIVATGELTVAWLRGAQSDVGPGAGVSGWPG